MFVALTGVGKTHLALTLLESEYKNHFNFIKIICPTLVHNQTYKSGGWVRTDPDLFITNWIIIYTIGLKRLVFCSLDPKLYS